MNLEQQRNESQRKLNDVSEELNRQKKELDLIPVSHYLNFFVSNRELPKGRRNVSLCHNIVYL